MWRKLKSTIKRWTDAHVPMVVKPGAYDDVANDLDQALSDAGFDLAASPAPSTMSKPAKWIAFISGELFEWGASEMVQLENHPDFKSKNNARSPR